MKYKVTIGNNNKFHGLTRDFFEEGEEVKFFVMFVTDVNTYVTSKDVHLKALPNTGSNINYSFIMPAHDVVVDVSFRGGMTCQSNATPPEMAIMGMMAMKGMMGMMNTMPNPTTPDPANSDSKFCHECGAKIPKTNKFCSNCGVKCR